VLEKSEFEAFVLIGGETRDPFEYRFQGALGFGGKVWLNNGEFPYVTCYPEDLTDEREAMIRSANEALKKLSGIKETSGAPVQLVTSKLLEAGQVTKCRLENDVFYVRENLVDGKQVLELLAPDQVWKKIEGVIRLEDSMGREIVRNPEFTVEWAEMVLAESSFR
jgi:hypothetical protein